jgi:UDP:flavonoid glycosyltransferase YjiC (YdhE family)
MVGHGGAGTTLAALAGGVPQVLLPVFADQPINAERVAEFGAGLALDMSPEGLAQLGAAVRELLVDQRYRAAARRVADEIASLPPVDEAVELLEAVGSGPRVRPARLDAVA